MERLNDIMGRNAQRRQQPSEQRPAQGPTGPGQVQRLPHASHAPQAPQLPPPAQGPRRALPEQTARLGQQSSYTPQHAYYSQHDEQPPYTSRTRGGEQESRGHNGYDSDAYEQRNYGAPGTRPPINRQRTASNSASSYAARPRPLEEVQPQPVRPLPPHIERDYRYGDAYPPAQADVVGEWEEEENTTGMRYGDWEDDDSEPAPYYQPEDREIAPPSRLTRQLNPRELNAYGFNGPTTSSHPAPEPRDMRDLRFVTRNLRDTREARDVPEPRDMRAAIVPAAQPPLPQSRTQEIHRSQRNTQPLNPHAMTGVSRGRGDMPHDPQQNQRPSRPAAPREQEQPSASLPAPVKARGICPKCKGAGYLRIDVPFGHPSFGKPVACDCKESERKERRREQLKELSDLSAFQSKTFRSFNLRTSGLHPSIQDAYHLAYAYAQNPEGWLFFVGPNGCGKTHLAAAIANQNLSNGAVVLFSVVPDLLAHLRSTFAPNALEAYDQRFSKMREAELLVLDDLGAHQSSPWASEKLFQLLNYRYNSSMPTVITANRPGWNSIDERIRSRLSDTALVITVNMDGARDHRPQNSRRGYANGSETREFRER